MSQYHPKQKPRHPDGLHVVVVGRVSTVHQDVNNIEAGYAYAEQALEGITDAPLVIRRFGEQSSGMIVERESILAAQEQIDQGWADLVIMEDLSKAFRNPRWMAAFVQDCVDAGVRVIAPGDQFDTWDEHWELMLSTSSMRHGLHIPDTRRRVRRTATASFHKGGMVLRAKFGYEKFTPEQAKQRPDHPDELLIAKVDEQTPVIERMWRLIVEQRLYGQAVVDALNERNVPTGPYVQSDRWSWDLVRDLLRDPILCGYRRFRRMMHQPVFKTGKHRREKNANPEQEHFPCLAHLSEQKWQQLQKAMDELAPAARPRSGPDSPRHRVPRCDSVTPYQHATCVVCGSFYYRCGADAVKCKKAWTTEHDHCWNHVQLKTSLVRQALIDLLLERLDRHPAARETLIATAWEQMRQAMARSNHEVADYDRQIDQLKKQESRLAEAIKSGVGLDAVREEARSIEKTLKEVRAKRRRAASKAGVEQLPQSPEQMAIDPRAVLLELAETSFAFADLLRRIIPRFVIQPVQQIDSGLVRPRATLTLDLSVLLEAGAEAQSAGDAPEEYAIDLFQPPTHVQWLEAVLDTKRAQPRWGYVRVAHHLQIGRMTVKRALNYSRLMQQAGLSEPYRVLRAAPAHASRWRSPEQRRPRRRCA